MMDTPEPGKKASLIGQLEVGSSFTRCLLFIDSTKSKLRLFSFYSILFCLL